MRDRYLTLVERFVAVAEAGTILGAANQLNLSQPSVTRSIRRIEEIFECTLFERTKKGVVLTLTGELLLKRSRLMLEQSRLVHEEISDVVSGRTGSLRIVAGTVWGTRYLPPIVRDLQQSFPELKIEVEVDITPVGLEKLHKGEADLVIGGFLGEMELHAGFTRETLVDLRYAAGCGKNSPLARAKNVSVQQIAQSPIVLYHDDELLMSSVIDDIEADGISLNKAVKTKSVLVALEMVVEGPYVLFLAEDMLRRHEASGVRIIDLAKPLYRFQTAMFYRDSLRQTEPFDVLVTKLRNFRKP